MNRGVRGGQEDEPSRGRSLQAWAEGVAIKAAAEDTERAGGRLAKAKKRAAECLILPLNHAVDPNPLDEIGHEIDEFVQDRLQHGLAKGTRAPTS